MTLIEKMEAELHEQADDPTGMYHKGVADAFNAIRQHEAEVIIENDRVRIAGKWYYPKD